MTTTALPPARAGRLALRPGSAWFTFVLAMGMAITALGVDTVLPAFPDIREAMDLDAESTKVAGLVTFFLMGSSAGLLPAGLLADRFGRRPVMWGGLVLYVAGAIGALLAPTLSVMFAARFVWGLGSAGPRVAVTAMVRDAYAGEQMAKQMSFIMAVFVLVPTFAPSISAGLLLLGPWQLVFWLCAAAGAAMLVATWPLPETLAPEDRTTLSAADVWGNCRAVLTTPGTGGYLVALTALFGVFLSYLASSEIIIDQTFGLDDWFPLVFGGLSIVLGISMFVNGRIVERVGLDRLLGVVFAGSAVAVAALFALALATDGEPPFWLFVVMMGAVLFAHQMLIPDINAAAMRPLAHVAGTAAAILGMVPGVIGAVIGTVIDRQFDGTIRPLAIAYVVATAVAIGGWRWAVLSRARQSRDRPHQP